MENMKILKEETAIQRAITKRRAPAKRKVVRKSTSSRSKPKKRRR